MRNAANCANCGYNTKFRIIPRTAGDDPEEAAAAPSCAAVRRNGNIRTVTIKSGGADTTLSRRWWKSGRRLLQTRRLPAEQRENTGNKLSRSFPQAVTDLWFIARLRRRILGEAKKRAHRCSFRDISQDRNEQSSRRRRERPPRYLLSTPRDTIVRRVNTFVDRENRRTLFLLLGKPRYQNHEP